MKRLAAFLLILTFWGCRDFGFNYEDNVQSYPDYGQSVIENNLWYKWFPLSYGNPQRFYYTLKIDRDTWTVNVIDQEVGGTVEWNENRLIFLDTHGDILKDCSRPGTYIFEIKVDEVYDTVLNLLMEEDPCPRMGYITGWWWKVVQ